MDKRGLLQTDWTRVEEYESRITHSKWKKHGRRNFIKAVLTICVAGLLATLWTLFAGGYFDSGCQHGNSNSTTIQKSQTNDTNTRAFSPQCSSTPDNGRMDCWPQSSGVSQQACEDRGCCWKPIANTAPQLLGVPWCFYPSNYQGYIVQNLQTSATGITAQLHRTGPSGWPNDITNLAIRVTYETDKRLNFRIYDPNNQRYEVPLTLNKGGAVQDIDTDYRVDIPTHGPFQITVTRKSTGKVLFSTVDAAPLIFADQFLQIGTKLSSKFLYGLGEHRGRFLISTDWTKMGFWSRDEAPTEKANLYGVHPFYMNMEEDRNAHGVFLLNSNAMEVEVQPVPSLAYFTSGGIFDFYIFTGPSAEGVVQQYTDFIGRPFMPPYWSLGFHQCRWGYGGTSGFQQVIKRMRDAQMPFDTMWNDIDYMRHHLDWTYDTSKYSGLPAVINDLHQHGQHYIVIVDPGISSVQSPGSYPPYEEGLKQNVFIKRPDGTGPIIGEVWPGKTAFPDFFHPNATAYWTKSITDFHAQLPFDGLWIDMNEPSSFVAGSTTGCPDNALENPPFKPPAVWGTKLKDKTLCASSKQYVSTHYNLHSLYGHSEAIATKRALDSLYGNKRSIIISRSTFPSTGVHAGHWTGDNSARWDNTYWSISGILNFNLFGIPLVGADICGFNGETNPELCARWMQLGAFYPFMRNHNSIDMKDQDPAVFDAAHQKIMRDALNLRYTLLPFLYTLFYRSHVDGTTVARPLFFEFQKSDGDAPYTVDTQFMWGSTLLITPATSASTLEGQGYLPAGRWYDWFTRDAVDSSGHMTTFQLPMEHINLLMRGGNIIPTQAPNVTTTLARKNPFTLVVAFNPDSTASGEMYWDDGETLDAVSGGTYNLISFRVAGSTLSSTVVSSGYTGETMTMGGVTIMGLEVAPTSISVNGQTYTDHYNYHQNKVLEVYGLAVNLLQPLTLSWTV